MSALLERPVQVQSDALTVLARGLVESHTFLVRPESLNELLCKALEQLEFDDSIDPELTDEMAEALVDSQERFLSGEEPWAALERFLGHYARLEERKSLEQIWWERAQSLTSKELQTELMLNFQEAVRMARSGRGQLLMSWLEAKISEFQARWNGYAEILVTEEEVTLDSVLCHRFLKTGVGNWLEAFKGLRATVVEGSSPETALEKAVLGQRCLMAVQLFEAEAAMAETRYFVNFN